MPSYHYDKQVGTETLVLMQCLQLTKALRHHVTWLLY